MYSSNYGISHLKKPPSSTASNVWKWNGVWRAWQWAELLKLTEWRFETSNLRVFEYIGLCQIARKSHRSFFLSGPHATCSKCVSLLIWVVIEGFLPWTNNPNYKKTDDDDNDDDVEDLGLYYPRDGSGKQVFTNINWTVLVCWLPNCHCRELERCPVKQGLF